MAKKIVTLYIDDTSIRLVVTDGKSIKEWAELELEPGLVDSGVVIDETEVATKIKEILKDHKVNAKNVSVGVSGLRCLSRPITLPQLPKQMLDEAVMREARRALPVPLEQLYMSWQTIPAPEGKTQVFLGAIPSKTADTILKAVQRAGLQPNFMDIKPLLLARVAKEATSVIVDVQKSEFDLVIMTDGVPQPIRSIPFLDAALSWEEKLTVIGTELDRTIQFYNSNNPEKPLADSISIFASGELANNPELCQALSNQLGRPVLAMPPPLECPEGFAASRYMVNLSLALQMLSPGRQAGLSLVNLNALPALYRPKPTLLTNAFALPAAAIAAALVAFLVVLMQITVADIASTDAQLKATEQQIQQRQLQRNVLTKNIAELEKKITETKASGDNLVTALTTLENQKDGFYLALKKVVIESLSSNVSLSSITYGENTLTISGQASDGRVVVSYFRRLDISGRLGEVAIQNMSSVEGEGATFALTGNLEKENGITSTRAVVDNLPSTITLTSLSPIENGLTIGGTAPDENEILSYMRRLEASGKFSDITSTSMIKNKDGGMDFSLILLILKTGE